MEADPESLTMSATIKMSLFACPNELLEQVIHELSDDDLESFATTCKLIRKLAGPMLKSHYTLKNQYDHKINYPGRKAIHPAELLDAIITNPRAASYIKALSLTYCPSPEFHGRNAALSSRQNGYVAVLEKHDYFWPMLMKNPYIPKGEVSSWYNRIKEGHLDALFALLLHSLHNLQELRIDRPILLPLTFVMIARLKTSIGHRTLKERADGYHAYSVYQEPKSTSQELGLSKLKQVIIDPAANWTEAHRRNRLTDFARFASFSSFPDLQHLHGTSLCSRKYNLDQNLSGFSSLRSIRLVNCNVAAEALNSLFSGIKSLESFHYTPTYDVTELGPVVDSLKRYAGHSLKKLYLRHSAIEVRAEAWKYRAFEQLKAIDLDWQCLVHYEESAALNTAASQAAGPFSASNPPASPKKAGKRDQKIQHPLLADVMPTNIESIKIVDLDGKANLEAIRWLFFKLSMSLGRFPNLKIVVLVTPRKDCWMHAKGICSRAGLKFPAYSCEKEKRLSGIDFVYG